MKTKITIALTSLFFLLLFAGCSKDDELQTCRDPSITMIVNGELQTFQAQGYGIDLEGNGHRLQLYFHRSEVEPYLEQSGFVKLRFKKTGEQIIEKIYWHQYSGGVGFDAELNQSQIQSNIVTIPNGVFMGFLQERSTTAINK